MFSAKTHIIRKLHHRHCGTARWPHQGSLDSYLQKQALNGQPPCLGSEDCLNTKMQFCVDIARGMEHLVSRRIVR